MDWGLSLVCYYLVRVERLGLLYFSFTVHDILRKHLISSPCPHIVRVLVPH